MNNSGNIFQLPVILMGVFLVLTFLVALLPAFSQMIGSAKASNSLNCPGYNDTTTYNHALDYNASKATSTIACMAIDLYVPYIVLGVIIASVAVLFGQNINFGGGQQAAGGYY